MSGLPSPLVSFVEAFAAGQEVVPRPVGLGQRHVVLLEEVLVVVDGEAGDVLRDALERAVVGEGAQRLGVVVGCLQGDALAR